MDLDEGEEDLDANAFQVKVETIKEDLDELEGDSGLEKALAKARRLKELRSESRKNTRGVFDPAELVARQVKEEVSIKEETEEQMAGSEFISTFVDDLPVAGENTFQCYGCQNRLRIVMYRFGNANQCQC